ncbi:hypothetical protein HHI36_014567 [Cryptolaemus montrouzieri]|uniref:Uncharacterized protein n=1 Tax=Cryptolaemus montrouzieri TaxID=559131 RepID=A0ABD2N3E3_9CUCU
MDTSLQNEEIDESDSNLNEITSNSPHNSNDNENKSEVLDEINDQCHKSTFKNVLQAKKRLQAFSVQKQIPISSSTSKTKLKTVFVSEKTYNEKGEIQENLVPLRKPPKKADNPIDKAKAVIEEIELLKKIELLGTTPLTIEEKLMSMSAPKRSRSRSKSSERDFVFRKREKKVRNYRRSDSGRRSPSPLLTKTREKPSEKSSRYKYPKNWDEFFKEKWTFEKLFSKMSHPSGRNNIPSDITRQLLFKTPAEVIKPFYYKNEKGEEISVPYKFLRHTLVEPKIPYNCNQVKFKEQFLTREQTLSNTHKNYRMYLEKFLERSNRTKFRTTEPIGQRNWYQKCWKDNETKVLESSIGLSFLQNYSDDDDEEEEVDQVQLTEMESIVVKKEENKKKTDGNNTKEYIKNEEDAKIKVRDRCSEKKKEEVSFPDHGENISKYSKTDQKMTEITTVSFIEGEIERNAEKSKSVHEEELDKKDVITSWTPERIVPTIIDQWDEMPKKKKDKSTQDVKKNKKQIDTNCQNIEEKQKAREIYSEDEWDETPTRKKEKSISEEADVKKFKKKKNRKKSVSESSSSEEKKKTKKKRKLDKKKKQKEKEKKARKKKEKLKAEKLKQKKEKKKKLKLKEREAEKEILKKLKKEIENSLVEVEREEREKIEINKSEQIADPPIRVKVEKEDSYEQTRRPVEDLRNFLDKKIGKTRGKIEEKTSDIEKHTEIDEGRDERKNKRMNKISVIKDWKKQAKVKEEKCNENNDKIIDSPKFNISNKTGVYVESQNPANSAQETAESSEKEPAKPKLKSEKELTGETTPDTDEYHSNWESDDGISPIVKMDTKKADRSWESDEEIFERSYSKKDQGNIPLGESPLLEMPLHIKKFSRRNFDRRESKGSRSRTRSPEYLDVDSEIKLLEEERINLSKERMRLEIERIRIHELERKKSMEEIEYINEGEKSPTWSARNFRKKQDKRQSRWDLKDDHVDSSTSKHRREKSVERHSRCEEGT